MSDDPRFDQAARSWLELGPTRVPERTVQALLLAIETTPQQRGLTALWRTHHMLAFATGAAAAALLMLVALGPFDLLQSTVAPGSPTLPPTLCPSPLASGSIATIAGTGEAGSDEDGPSATEARVAAGWGIAVDDAGNVYFSDQVARAVRRIGTDGSLATVAGPATGAEFVEPQGLAFDEEGTLFVSDIGASRIWRIEADGSGTAVAGTGVSGTKGNEGPAIDAADPDDQPGDRPGRQHVLR